MTGARPRNISQFNPLFQNLAHEDMIADILKSVHIKNVKQCALKKNENDWTPFKIRLRQSPATKMIQQEKRRQKTNLSID